MKKSVLLVLAGLAVTGCTDPDTAVSTLESAGYSEIETGNYGLFACGNDDTFATKFKAVNPKGVKTEGVVCSGWLKGGTIRH